MKTSKAFCSWTGGFEFYLIAQLQRLVLLCCGLFEPRHEKTCFRGFRGKSRNSHDMAHIIPVKLPDRKLSCGGALKKIIFWETVVLWTAVMYVIIWNLTLFSFFFFIITGLNEPRHKKTCLWGLQPGKTQTGLLSYRDQLGSWNFRFSRYCTI